MGAEFRFAGDIHVEAEYCTCAATFAGTVLAACSGGVDLVQFGTAEGEAGDFSSGEGDFENFLAFGAVAVEVAAVPAGGPNIVFVVDAEAVGDALVWGSGDEGAAIAQFPRFFIVVKDRDAAGGGVGEVEAGFIEGEAHAIGGAHVIEDDL